MAQITHVKKAQQRFVMVPVIDETTGEQKRTAVMNRSTNEQKTDKHGSLVWMGVTVADTNQPLPNYICEKCNQEIRVGAPYQHVTPKSGPYGGTKRTRCGSCPSWEAWELSNSLSARVQQIVSGAESAIENAEDKDSVESALAEAAEEIRALAEEKRESAQNMEDGFGHATSQSDELADIAEQLDSWADDVENADVPDDPEPEEDDCEECEGTGRTELAEGEAPVATGEQDAECDNCGGSGQATPEEPTDEQLDEWREAVEDATSVLNECPV